MVYENIRGIARKSRPFLDNFAQSISLIWLIFLQQVDHVKLGRNPKFQLKRLSPSGDISVTSVISNDILSTFLCNFFQKSFNIARTIKDRTVIFLPQILLVTGYRLVVLEVADDWTFFFSITWSLEQVSRPLWSNQRPRSFSEQSHLKEHTKMHRMTFSKVCRNQLWCQSLLNKTGQAKFEVRFRL